MGLFDTILISDEIEKSFKKQFKKFPKKIDWQTKDLSNFMDHYILKKDDKDNIRLYLMDTPSIEDAVSKKFWVLYTQEEIDASKGKFFKIKPGDGYFKEEAFDPINRKHRFMGDMPHQIINIYSCGGNDFWMDLKFTDGMLVAVREIEENCKLELIHKEWIEI